MFESSFSPKDQCGVDVYCGAVCCSEANVQQGCCVTTSIPMSVDNVCCAREALNEARECGSTTCPTDLPEELVYDSAVTPAELRNQCCLYFREGCCSQSENNFLDLLWVMYLLWVSSSWAEPDLPQVGGWVSSLVRICLAALTLPNSSYEYWSRC